MATLLRLFALFALPWWAGVGSLLYRSAPRWQDGNGRRSRWLAFAQGWGLVTIAVLPVAIAQPWVDEHTSFTARTSLLLPAISPGIHAGGWTVRVVFEPLAESGAFGHRQTTMISNWPVFWTLSVVQTSIIAGSIGARLRARDRRRHRGERPARIDPATAALGAAVLGNAALNIAWPWWGS